MPLLAPHVLVAACDRAGLGGSDPAPGLATIDRMIDGLASVITGRDETRRGTDVVDRAVWSVADLQELLDEWIIV